MRLLEIWLIGLCLFCIRGAEALTWKEKGTSSSCAVTCGNEAAVSAPLDGNSSVSFPICAVNGSQSGSFSTGAQVGTIFFVQNVLSCWVYSSTPGGPSATSHSDWYCLCAGVNDTYGNLTGSTTANCASTCASESTFNTTLASCKSPTVGAACYVNTGTPTFGYQNATASASDQSCLTASLPATQTAQTPELTRAAGFQCLCTTPGAAPGPITGNCSTLDSNAQSVTAGSPPQSSSSSGSSAGAIAGGVVGGVVGFCLLAALGFFIWRRRRARQLSTVSNVSNPFSKPDAQFSLKPSMADSHELIDFDDVVKRHKAGLTGSSDESKSLGLTTLGSDATGMSSITSTNFAVLQDKIGSRAANLPTPNTGSENGTSPDGIQSIKLHDAPSVQDSEDLDDLQHTWKIEPQDLQCRMKGGEPIVLGEGGFGKVYLGILHREDVAIKVVTSHTAKQQERFLREIKVLRACHNTHIVQFEGACVRDQQTFMVMQYMAGGDLLKRLSNDSTGDLGWYRKGSQIALAVARGLIYLHSKNIAHLDLKSPNVMLTDKDDAKICDVGLGKIVANPNHIATQQGSFLWASPEQLNGRTCTVSSDIFSFGTVLWEICTHELPINRQTRPLRIPEEAPQEVSDLIDLCHSFSSEDRPTATQVNDYLLRALK